MVPGARLQQQNSTSNLLPRFCYPLKPAPGRGNRRERTSVCTPRPAWVSVFLPAGPSAVLLPLRGHLPPGCAVLTVRGTEQNAVPRNALGPAVCAAVFPSPMSPGAAPTLALNSPARGTHVMIFFTSVVSLLFQTVAIYAFFLLAPIGTAGGGTILLTFFKNPAFCFSYFLCYLSVFFYFICFCSISFLLLFTFF